MAKINSKTIAFATRFGVGVLALVLAFSVFSVLLKSAPELSQEDRASTARELTVFAAFEDDVRRQWRGYGVAEALNSSDVPARVSATVLNIPELILPGASIDLDTELIRLDAADYDTDVTAAESDLLRMNAQVAQIEAEAETLVEQLRLAEIDVAIATREQQRVQQVVDRGAGQPADLDDAERVLNNTLQTVARLRQQSALIPTRIEAMNAQLAAEQSRLDRALLEQSRAIVRSPIPGILQSIDVEVGEILQPGVRVARVVDLRKIEVPVRLPASSRATVRVGDTIVLSRTGGSSSGSSRTAAGASGPVFEARIERIAPEDGRDSRTFTVYTLIEQPDANEQFAAGDTRALIMPGQFLQARVFEARTEVSFLVPRRSINADQILVVRDGRLRRLPVTPLFTLAGTRPETGLPDDQWAAVQPLDWQSESDADADAGATIAGLRKGDFIVLNASTAAVIGDDVIPVVVGGEDPTQDAAPAPSAPGTRPSP